MATKGKEGRELFLLVLLAKLETESVKDAATNPLECRRPYTGDPILHAHHAERSFEEEDACSDSLHASVDVLVASLRKRNPRTTLEELGRFLTICCAAARRLGGRKLCERLPLAFADNLDAFETAPTVTSLVSTVVKGLLTEKHEVVTLAHLPHSAAYGAVRNAKTIKNKMAAVMQHWSNHRKEDRSVELVDWEFLVDMAPSIGRAAATSCARAARLWALVKGWGGTYFLMKTPLRDVARALQRAGATEQVDWRTWGPPGPGARACLDRLCSRARHGGRYHVDENDGLRVPVLASKYSGATTDQGQMYQKLLNELHEWMTAPTQINRLSSLLTRDWLAHDTQAHCCFMSRYFAIRDSMVCGTKCPQIRTYPRSPRWVEKGEELDSRDSRKRRKGLDGT